MNHVSTDLIGERQSNYYDAHETKRFKNTAEYSS
jgi:hypothetical protein